MRHALLGDSQNIDRFKAEALAASRINHRMPWRSTTSA